MEEWVKAVIVLLHKGRGKKDECKNYRGMNLLSIAVKVYVTVVTDREKVMTEGMIRDEQHGFKKGRGCGN